MRVAYDARLYDAPPTGIGRWTRGLLHALIDAAPDVTWVVLGNADALAPIAERPNVEVLDTRPRRQILWQLRALPRLLQRARADALISVWNLVTAPGFRGQQLVWLHDLICFRAMQHGFRWTYQLKTHFQWALARRRLDRLVCVSQFTADDVRASLGLPDDRLAVVHPGFDLEHFRASPPERAEAVRQAHGLPARFVFAVGGAEPRKNLRLLVDAWRELPCDIRGDVVLALGGSDFRGRTVLDGIDDAAGLGIRDLGRIPDGDLMPLYTAAHAFAYPSLSEGFGMPPIEAMACGTPVLAARATSLPEATADAALLADPTVPAFTDALSRLLTDDALRARLVDQGRARARSLTWEHAARAVLALVQRPAAS